MNTEIKNKINELNNEISDWQAMQDDANKKKKLAIAQRCQDAIDSLKEEIGKMLLEANEKEANEILDVTAQKLQKLGFVGRLATVFTIDENTFGHTGLKGARGRKPNEVLEEAAK